jgi:hypothetical protein
VVGGLSLYGAGALNNTVYINGSAMLLHGVHGAPVIGIAGGFDASDQGRANGNLITINNSTITRDGVDDNEVVIGGGFVVPNGDDGTGSVANGNAVFIRNSTIGETERPIDIYGGVVMDGDHGSGNNNSITLGTSSANGNPQETIQIHGNLYGGRNDLSSGNALNVYKSQSTVISGFSGFQTLNFHLPANIGAGDVVLTISGEQQWDFDDGEFVENSAHIAGSTINIAIDGGDLTRLAQGQSVKLITSTTGRGIHGNLATTTVSVPHGDLTYDFSISVANGDLLATLVTNTGMDLRSSIYLYHQPVSGIAAKADTLAGYNCDVFQMLLDVESGYTDIALLESAVASNTAQIYSDRIHAGAPMFSYTLYAAEPVKTFALGQFLDGAAATGDIGTVTVFGYCFSTRADAKVLYYDGAGTCHLSGGTTVSCAGAPNTPAW